MRLWPRAKTAAGAIAAIAIAAAAAAACGTDAVGVDACRRVEAVRCESARACGIDLTQPVHRGGDSPEADAKADVGACIRYYDVQCLHGLVTSVEPAPQAVDACVEAIITGDCNVVISPETHPACAWLIPPAPPPEPPPAPAPAADAATE